MRTFNLDNLKSPTGNLSGKEEYLIRKGDIVFARTGASVGKSYLHKEIIKDVYFAGYLIRIRSKNGIEPKFIFYNTLTSEYKKFVKITSARSGQPGINANEYKSYKLYTPNYSEQKSIGKMLSKIDKIITLEQEKLAYYELIRENILSKVFPLGESLIPELRFKSFKGNWVKIPLSEISDKVNNKNTDKKYTITLTNSATQGIMSQSEYFDKQISNPKNIDNYYVVNNDDFVYNPRISLSAPYGPLNRNTLGFTGIMSPLYYVFKPRNINLDYLEYYFKSTNWHRFMYQNGDTGARSDRFSISNKLFETMPIKVPVQIEQDKIGRMLKQLDDIIIHEQHRVEKLNEIKKTLLNKLFV